MGRAITAIVGVFFAVIAWRATRHAASSRTSRAPAARERQPSTEAGKGNAGTSGDDPHVEIDTSQESTASATGSAVAHVLARPDSIRQRAQNAATTSSAVAAALLVAAVVQLTRDEYESWRWWTMASVAFALISWIVSVGLFVHVVTHGRSPRPQDRTYQALVEAYEDHSANLRSRLRRAAIASGVALVVTAIAVMFQVAERTYTRERDRQIVLTAAGVSAVARLCGWRVGESRADPRVNVRVSTDELAKTIVKLNVVSRPSEPTFGAEVEDCQAPTSEMRLPRGSILATNDVEP